MTSLAWIFFAVALALVLLVRSLALWPLDKALRQTLASKDIGFVRAAIARVGAGSRPTAYNHAVRRLWNAYERGLAAELIRELAAQHPDSHIAQYWLQQALTAEPALARAAFSQSFLDAYYQPEVAARCGPVG